MRRTAIYFLAAALVASVPSTGAAMSPLASEPAVAEAPDVIQLAQAATAEEVADWNRIVDSNNPDDFFDFIAKHPNGVFRTTAEAQVKRLVRQGAGAAPKPAEVPAPQQVDPAAAPPAPPAVPAEAPAPVIRQAVPTVPAAPAKEAATEPSSPAVPAQPATAVPSEASGATAEIVALRTDTQRELGRLGCYGGVVDGKWDARSSEALRLYARRKGLVLASLDPSKDVLDRLMGEKGGFCPTPACIVTEVLRNGQCVQKVCAVGQSLSSDGKCRAGSQEAAVPAQPQQPEPAAAATVPPAPAVQQPAASTPAAPAVATPRQPAPAAPRRTVEEPRKPQRNAVTDAPARANPSVRVETRAERERRRGERYESQPQPRQRRGQPPCSAAFKGLPEYDHCE